MSTAARCLALLVATAVCALAAEPVDDELARFNEATARLDKTLQDGLARERARSLPVLVASARRETGDAAADAWKQVLALDPGNEEARRFFTALGKLDAVLAELQARKGLLIGKGELTAAKPAPDPRLDMSGAKVVRIQGLLGQGVGLGNHRAGSIILIQYVSGTWSSGPKLQSPDAADTADGNRAELLEDTGNEPTLLATIPAGTAATPFSFTLEKNSIGLTLRIKNQDGRPRAYEGEVQYRVKVLPPGR